jgi:excisionase family DNA binding protein
MGSRKYTTVPPEPDLLTAREAADRLNVCQRTVRRLGWRGDLRMVRIGRAVRYPATEVLALIQSSNDEDRVATPGLVTASAHHRRHGES